MKHLKSYNESIKGFLKPVSQEKLKKLYFYKKDKGNKIFYKRK